MGKEKLKAAHQKKKDTFWKHKLRKAQRRGGLLRLKLKQLAKRKRAMEIRMKHTGNCKEKKARYQKAMMVLSKKERAAKHKARMANSVLAHSTEKAAKAARRMNHFDVKAN